MKKIFLLLCMLCIAIGGSRHAAAEAIQCRDTADVYIDQCLTCTPPGGDTNFNAKTRVLVSYHPTKGLARSLLKFDIPSEIAASRIERATLYLSGSAHTGGGVELTIACHALNAPFNEGTDTWNSLNGGNFDAALFSTGTLPAGTTWKTAVDVTDLLTENLDKVRDNGILIKLAAEGPDKEYQSIASRESDNPENPDYAESDEPPRLELAYPAAAGSTTTVTATTSTTVPPSTTSSTTTTVPCPVVKMFNGENSREVTAIRALRNRRLAASIDGLALIYLYYTNTEELTAIFSADSELSECASRLIRELTPALELSLAQNTTLAITQKQHIQIITILKRAQNEASPGLRKKIDGVMKRLNSGEILKVMGISIQEQ